MAEKKSMYDRLVDICGREIANQVIKELMKPTKAMLDAAASHISWGYNPVERRQMARPNYVALVKSIMEVSE